MPVFQASLKTDITVFDLLLSGTASWATSPYNPANWPSTKASATAFGKVDVPSHASSARMRIGVSDANNEYGGLNIWGKDNNGAQALLLQLTDVTAGSAVLGADLATGDTLTDFFFADSATKSAGIHKDSCVVVKDANGIMEVTLPLFGFVELVVDGRPLDISSDGTCEDLIVWMKWVTE
jgi:hypothetical protein